MEIFSHLYVRLLTLTILPAVVAFSAFRGGIRSGLISTAMVSPYGVYYLSTYNGFLNYTPVNLPRLGVLVVTSSVITLIVGSVHNAPRASERRLRRQLDFTQAINNSLGEGVYALDRQGRLTFMNQAAERMLDWSSGELLGQNMHDIIHFQREDSTRHPYERNLPWQIVTMSTGISALVPGEDKSTDTLLREPNTALYKAKHGGRNQVVIHDEALVTEHAAS